MEIRQITDDYAVAGQITAADIPAIAEAGYKSIVCNRPDGETDGQPEHGAIEAAARQAGLEFRYIPVVSGQMTPDNVADHAAALGELPAPVLAYCRSGARSTNIFVAAEANR